MQSAEKYSQDLANLVRQPLRAAEVLVLTITGDTGTNTSSLSADNSHATMVKSQDTIQQCRT